MEIALWILWWFTVSTCPPWNVDGDGRRFRIFQDGQPLDLAQVLTVFCWALGTHSQKQKVGTPKTTRKAPKGAKKSDHLSQQSAGFSTFLDFSMPLFGLFWGFGFSTTKNHRGAFVDEALLQVKDQHQNQRMVRRAGNDLAGPRWNWLILTENKIWWKYPLLKYYKTILLYY